MQAEILKSQRMAAVGLIVLGLAATPAAAATIKLANGDVIEGTIQGHVVIVMRSREGSDGGFRVVAGDDIVSIDEGGIAIEKGESLVLVGMDGARPSDVLKGLIWWNEGRDLKPKRGLIRKVGRAQVVGSRVPNESIKPIVQELAGDYQINQGAETVTLIPSIRVKKADGATRTIALSDIVPFRVGTPR
jgi:hypothetical protein